MENEEKNEVTAVGSDSTESTVATNDVQYRTEVMEHFNLSSDKIKAILMMAVARIESLKPGEKIPATTLADEIARDPSVNSTGAYLYPVLKYLINEKYPGVKIMRGAHGGILKL